MSVDNEKRGGLTDNAAAWGWDGDALECRQVLGGNMRYSAEMSYMHTTSREAPHTLTMALTNLTTVEAW